MKFAPVKAGLVVNRNPRNFKGGLFVCASSDIEETRRMPFIGPILISLMYLIAAGIVWRTATAAAIDRSETALWRGISAALIALAINKLFEGAITDQLRAFAWEHGWYSQRQTAQVGSIAAVVIVCLLIATAVLFLTRHYPAATQIALIGIVMLLALGLVRDASLHQVDDLFGRRLFGLKVNWILELGGLGVVLVGSTRRRSLNI